MYCCEFASLIRLCQKLYHEELLLSLKHFGYFYSICYEYSIVHIKSRVPLIFRKWGIFLVIHLHFFIWEVSCYALFCWLAAADFVRPFFPLLVWFCCQFNLHFNGVTEVNFDARVGTRPIEFMFCSLKHYNCIELTLI